MSVTFCNSGSWEPHLVKLFHTNLFHLKDFLLSWTMLPHVSICAGLEEFCPHTNLTAFPLFRMMMVPCVNMWNHCFTLISQSFPLFWMMMVPRVKTKLAPASAELCVVSNKFVNGKTSNLSPHIWGFVSALISSFLNPSPHFHFFSFPHFHFSLASSFLICFNPSKHQPLSLI